MELNYCGNCGAASDTEVRFCRECGAGLEVEPVSPTAESSTDPKGTGRSSTTTSGAGPAAAVARPVVPQPRATVPIDSPSTATEKPVGSDRTKVTDTVKPASEGASAAKTPARPAAAERQPRAASALAQASGLEGASALGTRIRALLVGLAVFLVGVAAVFYYRQSLRIPSFDRIERNLVTPEEQSLNLIRMGERAHESGDYNTAIADFRQALSLTPRHSPTYLLLAQSLQSAGQLDEALRTYAALIRQDPQNLEARLEVAEIHRARGNWREAYLEYQRIISTDSQSLEAVAALALIEAHDGAPVAQSRTADPSKHSPVADRSSTSLLPLVLGRPQTPLAVSPSQLQGGLGAPPEAWSRTRTPDDERGDARALAETHKGLGMRYHNVREFQAAIREFSLAQRLTPKDKDLYYLIGSSYAGLGQEAVAHEYYKQCDSGPYASVARSGAQKTAKAARLEGKHPDGIGDADIGLPNRPTVNANGLK